jgi:hypothetical protein
MDLKYDMRLWIEFIWHRARTSDGNEPSSSFKAGKFLDQLSDYQLLIKNSAP